MTNVFVRETRLTHPAAVQLTLPPGLDESYLTEYRRLWHDEICQCAEPWDRRGYCPILPCGCPEDWPCPCGCHRLISCPSPDLCRYRIIHLKGAEQTRAVREWMALDLCICPFVMPRQFRDYYLAQKLPLLGTLIGDLFAVRNWRSRRRYKLYRCPCGAYFSEPAVRELGLCSESQWKRKGYPRFRDRSTSYRLDVATAKLGIIKPVQNPDGSWRYHTYTPIRVGPPPRAWIWRAFYDHARQRYEPGLWSVDLFPISDIDTDFLDLTAEQCLKILDRMHSKGDAE